MKNLFKKKKDKVLDRPVRAPVAAAPVVSVRDAVSSDIRCSVCPVIVSMLALDDTRVST
jgi:hypothetical protein